MREPTPRLSTIPAHGSTGQNASYALGRPVGAGRRQWSDIEAAPGDLPASSASSRALCGVNSGTLRCKRQEQTATGTLAPAVFRPLTPARWIPQDNAGSFNGVFRAFHRQGGVAAAAGASACGGGACGCARRKGRGGGGGSGK